MLFALLCRDKDDGFELRKNIDFKAPGEPTIEAVLVGTAVMRGVKMFFDTVTAVRVRCTYRTVVGALWTREATFRESRRAIDQCVPQEVFLFETEPVIIVIIFDRRTTV